MIKHVSEAFLKWFFVKISLAICQGNISPFLTIYALILKLVDFFFSKATSYRGKLNQ